MTVPKRVKNLPFLLLEQVPALACTGLSFLAPVVQVACSLQPSLLMMLQALGFVAFVLLSFETLTFLLLEGSEPVPFQSLFLV